MKRIYVITVLMLMGMLPSMWNLQAQTTTALSRQTSDKSIVRKYGSMVVYYNCNQDSSIFNFTTNRFNGATLVHLDSSVRVNDFLMVGNDLYFCGSREDSAGNHRVYAGVCPISNNSMFLTTRKIFYYDAPEVSAGVKLTDALKLAVFDQEGIRRIVMLVETEDTNGVRAERMLAELVYNDNDSSYVWFTYTEPGTTSSFSDFAVTDNYVVAASIKQETGEVDLRKFNKPDAGGMTTLFVSDVPDKEYLYKVNERGKCFTKPYMTCTKGDEVGLAYYGETEDNRKGLIVETLEVGEDIEMTKQQLDEITNFNIYRQSIKEMKYDITTRQFMLVVQHFTPDSPFFPSSYALTSGEVRIYSNESASSTEMKTINTEGDILYSLDGYTSQVCLTVGTRNGKICLQKFNILSTGECCEETMGYTTILQPVEVEKRYQQRRTDTIQVTIGPYIENEGHTTTDGLDIICTSNGSSHYEGIEEPELAELTYVMPNPASGQVTIASSFGLRSVDIYSMTGTLVMRQDLSGYAQQMDISALPSGTYLLVISTPAGPVTKKLLVQ